MDDNPRVKSAEEKIICFDKAFSNNHIQMQKVLLHYIPGHFRKLLTVFIKIQEMQQIMTRPFSYPPSAKKHSPATEGNLSDVIGELLPYCSEKERANFESLENMFQSMEQMKNMMEMMQTINEMKDMFGGDAEGFSPDMLASIMNMGREF